MTVFSAPSPTGQQQPVVHWKYLVPAKDTQCTHFAALNMSLSLTSEAAQLGRGSTKDNLLGAMTTLCMAMIEAAPKLHGMKLSWFCNGQQNTPQELGHKPHLK